MAWRRASLASTALRRSSASIVCLVAGPASSGVLQAGQRLAKPGLPGLSSNSSEQMAQTLTGKGIQTSWYVTAITCVDAGASLALNDIPHAQHASRLSRQCPVVLSVRHSDRRGPKRRRWPEEQIAEHALIACRDWRVQGGVIFLRAAVLWVSVFGLTGAVIAQDGLSFELLNFKSSTDLATKEAELNRMTTAHPDCGPALLKIAEETSDTDTEWMAIRGIGALKFKGAVPFLRRSLESEVAYVRANSARALGDMRVASAVPDLVFVIKNDDDGGVLEQTALALQMMGARDAVPALKRRANFPSAQTRLWILGAVETLGDASDLPFFAGFLNDKESYVAETAAHAIERLAGQDFGFPQCGPGVCISSPEGLRTGS